MKKAIIASLMIIPILIHNPITMLATSIYEPNKEIKDINFIFDKVIESFENEDKEELKSLFAPIVQNECKSLDQNIEDFFDILEGPIEVVTYNVSEGYMSSGGGVYEASYGGKDKFVIKANGEEYLIRLDITTRDKNDDNNKGVTSIEVVTNEAFDSENFAYHSQDGFYFQDSAEVRDDIKWFGGNSYNYVKDTRGLTVDTFLNFVNNEELKNTAVYDSTVLIEYKGEFGLLRNTIGEPTIANDNFNDYYYELADGRFLNCVLADDMQRSLGKKYNEIIALTIVDSEGVLEVIWADSDIKLIDGYLCIADEKDRSITEEEFLKLFDKTSYMSGLVKLIGYPDYSCEYKNFYKLSDGRYIELNYFTNEISDALVGSNNDFEIIWENKNY